jgi:hypothetical protein
MATKKKVEATPEVQIISGELETKLKSNLKKKVVEEPKETLGEVQVVVEEPKQIPVKMVKILMACDHKCCIGGEWYYLLKDKHYNVPENVKAVLMEANKLKPL